MCGIIGYIGKNNLKEELIENLKKLEYRGYDSAGIAYTQNQQILTKKSIGKISNLSDTVDSELYGNCGIAHTRWATHGVPAVNNAHPHLSNDKSWAVVHNGIIENFSELKEELINKHNVSFESETDTEVIPQYLQTLSNLEPMQALQETCKNLTGSYALACIKSSTPDTLYLAKNKSPLYVAINNGNVYVGSDPICFAGKSKQYYSLEDGEFCEANVNNLLFFDINNNVVDKNPTELSKMQESLGKENYEHFMLKEIKEVPVVLKRIVDTYRDNHVFDKLSQDALGDLKKIVIIGCGTAYNAGLMGAKYIEKFARLECRCYIASEFRYTNPIIDENTLCIFVSQSGETADTLACNTLAREKGAKTIALTNVLYSTLAKNVDMILPVCAGPEIAVASTKAYTAQISVFYMLAKHLHNIRFKENFDYLSQIEILSQNIIMPDETELSSLKQQIVKSNRIFFIGRDFDFITCEESSLKLKEIAYKDCYSHPSGELKHGFLALVDKDTSVFVVATQKDLLEKTLNAAHEVLARDGSIILVSQFDNILKQSNKTNYYLLQNFDEELMPIVSVGFFQTISYLTSISLGINPDQPRNLAKSVTVE